MSESVLVVKASLSAYTIGCQVGCFTIQAEADPGILYSVHR